MLNKIQHAVATIGFIGYLPYAPGTFGTALGFVLVLFSRPDDGRLFIIFLSLLVLGTICAHNAEKFFGKDSGRIVIDELCGYFLSVLLVPKTFGYLLGAFLLFRILDILKPPPIGKAEEAVTGGAGIMLDDILAGIYTNLCLQIWIYFFAK